MQTTILNGEFLSPAIEALKQGEVVAFPTETVYGLGADGLNADACLRIFEAKGRPSDNPLILHVLERDGLDRLTRGIVPFYAAALVEAFWPGPLTVVVLSSDIVPSVVRAGLDTVAVRAPSHPVARALIAGLGAPIAAPSANRSGRPSPTTAGAVYEDMQGRIAYIVDGGNTAVGVESTVVDCTTSPVTVLRPGGIGLDMLARVVGDVSLAPLNSLVRSPGMKYRHYAPRAPVVWIRSTDPAFVSTALRNLRQQYTRLVIAAPDPLSFQVGGDTFESLGPDEVTAANRLFRVLRALDERNPDAIVVVWESEQGLGLAVSNRIGKAAVRQVVPE